MTSEQGSTPEGEPERTVSQEVTGSLMGTGAGMAIGGPAGALVGAAAAPALTAMTRRVFGEFRQWRDSSAEGVVTIAAEQLGVDADELETRIRSTPQAMELAGEAIWTGWHTVNVQKVRALGKALANGLRDDNARIDRERLVIATLAELEEPHIRALVLFGSKPEGSPFPRRWTVDQVTSELRLRYEAPMLVAVLARSHLIEDRNAPQRRPPEQLVFRPQVQQPSRSGQDLDPNEAWWMITDFGWLCLGYLEAEPLGSEA